MNDRLIAEYAKKIYGFAYSRTNNCIEADDLSQEIALSLCSINFPEKRIGSLDAYVYRVCEYTWARFLRKNKRAREMTGSADCIDFIEDDADIEGELIRRESCEKLRREIMYLGRLRREAVIMFWYDGKS